MKTKMRPFSWLANKLGKRFVICALAALVFFTQVLGSLTVYAFSLYPKVEAGSATAAETPKRSSLVAILAEKSLLKDGADYAGLSGSYSEVASNTLGERIERYAKDVANAMPKTKVKIISVDSADKEATRKITEVLDKFYFEGEEIEGTISQLRGVVLVGAVPIPEVGMFPYTDFEDKYYIYNYANGEFEVNKNTGTKKAEVWHGVIKGSAADENTARQQIAAYLDKNHLYHIGNKDFTDFEKKILVADLDREAKSMTRAMFKNYLENLASMEDSAYFRYTKEWLTLLMKKFGQEAASAVDFSTMGDSTTEGMKDSQIEMPDGSKQNLSDMISSAADSIKTALQNPDSQKLNMPDIYTKFLIEQFLKPYALLFEKHLSEVNDWVSETGRWDTKTVDTMPSLITKQDLWAREYLKIVNNSIEKKIDEAVAKIQKPIPLIRYVEVSGSTSLKHDGSGNIKHAGIQTLMGFSGEDNDQKGASGENLIFLNNGFDKSMNQSDWKSYANGVDYANLSSVSQCSVYRGSAKVAQMLRTGNIETINSNSYPAEKNPPDPKKIPSLGVNVRPAESLIVKILTFGKYESGYVVAGDSYTGMPAVFPDDRNGVSKILTAGDILLEVDNKKLTPDYSLRDALKTYHPNIHTHQIINNIQYNTTWPEPTIIYYDLSDGKIKSKKIGIVDGNTGYFRKSSDTDYDDPSNGEDEPTGFVNCFALNLKNPERCFADFANMPVFDASASYETDENNPDIKHSVSPRACYNFNVYETPSPIDGGPRDGMYRYFKDVKLGYSMGYALPSGFYYNEDSVFGITQTSPKDSYLDDLYDGKDPGKLPLPKKPTKNLGEIPLVSSGDFNLADFLRVFSDAYDKNYDYDWDKFQKEFLEIDQEKTYLFRMRQLGELTNEIENKPAELQNKIKDDYLKTKDLRKYGIKVFVAEDNPIAADVSITFKPHLYKTAGAAKYIPSTVYHKQPDNYILEAQSVSPTADALPIDKPRYVAFINKLNGKETRVDYPNIFKANSYSDWISALKKKEMELYGLSAEDLSGILTSIFQKGVEAYAAANGKKDGVMTIIDEDKAEEAVEWKNLGIDEKHAKLLLDHNRGGKPYEAMYLNARGAGDFINMNFNGEAPSYDEDAEYNDLISKKEFEPDSGNPAVQDKIAVQVKQAEQSEYSYKYKYMGQDAVPLWDWLEAIKQWASNLAKQYSRAFSFDDSDSNKGSADKFYEIDDPGAKTFSLKLSAIDSKTTLQANGGDTASFRIEALDKNNAIDKTDNATSVEFKIIGNGIESEISGAATQYLANGYAIFQIISGEKLENFSVMAIGTKPVGGGTIYSNVLQINTVKKRLAVTPPQTILKAGSKTKFLIKVNVLDENDNIDSTDNKTLITIKSENDSDKYIKLLSNTAKVINGTAEFKAETTDKAGLVELSIAAGFTAPAVQTDFSVYPADPSKIELAALPNIIKTNGSRGKIRAVLLDANGNTAEGASNVYKFSISGPAKLVSQSEVMSFTGEAEVEFESQAEAGKIDASVSVETENGSLTSNVSIQSRPDISLSIEASANEIKANAESKALITVKATDGAGNIIQNYYSPISFSANQNTFGHFTDKVSTNIENGSAGAEFMSSIIAGTTTIKIDAPGFGIKLIDIKTVPLEPYQITLTSDKKSMISDEKDFAALSVNFFDKNMNRIEAGEYDVHLRITKSTQAYGKFEGENAAETDIKFINGFVNISLLSTFQSGSVHIVAETSAIKIPNDDADKTRNRSSLEIFSAKRFFATDFANAGATPLYATVVGEKFGDIANANYLAAELLFSGKTQAVMSMMNDFSAPNGFGFKDQNKHLLLLASGLSVGEAILSYIPDSAIVLGDPTVKLIGANEVSQLGYTKDIGQQIFSGDDTPKSVIPIDYDNNGAMDLFTAYSNGKIHLLENVGGSEKFRDRGVFLDIVNGINAVIAADIDNNGATDLIAATSRGCKKNEVCVDIYKNNNGFFSRENLPLKISKQAYMLATEDFNKDGWRDLALSDSVGDVRIFYNNNGTINSVGQKLGSLGANIDPNQNLADSVLFYYTGAKINEAANEDKPPHKDYETLVLPDKDKGGKETKFVINNSDNAAVSNLIIEKHVEAKAGSLDIGDTVKYMIKIRAKNSVNNLWISDYLSGVVSIDKNSIAHDGKACDESFKCIETGIETTPYALGGVNLWPGQKLVITYSAIVKFLPKITIAVVRNSDKVPVKDDIPDILANIEGNESGQVVYFYSTAEPDKTTGQTPFAEFVYADKKAAVPVDPSNFYGSADQNSAAVNAEMSKYYKDVLKQSFSFDNMLDNVAKEVENMVSSLRCSGGCLALPINHAFLVPGLNNNFGVPTGFQDGLPVFGTGCPCLFPIWPPCDYHSSVGFRFYVSPTLTGRVAFGFCNGPYLGGTCYAFAPPIGIPQGACDSINKSVSDKLSSVSGMMQSPGSDNFTLIAGGGQPTAEPSSGFQASKYFGNYPVKTYASTNITVPGFPAVIANWFDKQVEEILNKLGDGPDIYVIHPKWSNLIGSELVTPKEKLTGFTELLSYINSIPLVQIEGKDVAVKVPTITPREIEKVINDYKQFRRDFNREIKKVKTTYKCLTDEYDPDYDPSYDPSYKPSDSYDAPYTDPTDSTDICHKLKLGAGPFANSIEKNITALEEWKMFPKKIIEWRNIEAKYSRQIINYLTIISDYLGGYMNRQQKRINAWLDAVLKIKSIIEKWKVFYDIMIDYQTSCDSCKSDRFSLLELLFRIFMVVPEPPIVPFPKWPDLVLDFSQIQAGIKIIWPDFVFVPEPLIIPRLPRISLPIVLPDVFIDFEPLPVIPSPPPLPDLPNLPSLPLVRLPDLPPAPIIPDIANVGLKSAVDTIRKALKILCLIKKGLIPVPESSLKTEVETLTQRSLNPPLSIDLAGGIKTPPIIPGGPYSLLDKITATVKINAQVDTDVVYKAAEKAAEKFNKVVTGVMKVFNTELYKLQKVVEGATTLPGKIEMKDIDVNVKTKSLINYNEESYTSRLKKAIIDYQKDQGNITSHLLANNITNFEPASVKRYVAAVNGPDLSGGSTLPSSMDQYVGQMQSQGKPVGLFIVNSKLGVADKLIEYTEETQGGVQINYLDSDNDGDQDIVFNLGGDLFIKENHAIAAAAEKHFTDIDGLDLLDELLPNAISINNFASDYTNGSASFRWMASSIQDLAGYEITYRGANGVKKIRLTIDEPANENEEKLLTPAEPSYDLQIENGNYYAQVAAFDKDENQSTVGAAILMAPNICSDTASPMPNAGPSYHKIAVMKTLNLDASASVDQNGVIESYFMDTDLTKDDNADNDLTNDKNINNGLNPVFVLGPYEEVGQKNVKLFAVDQSGNYAGQEITIDVYVPGLELQNVSFEAGTALGATIPPESEMPVDLIRERKGAKDVLGEYKTNEKGEFYIEGLTNEGKIYIKNAKGEPVAEYDEKTGKIVVIKKGYYVDAEAEKNGPVMINLKDENGFILISIFYIPDSNTDTKIDNPDTDYTLTNTENFVGVHIKDTDIHDEFEFRKILGDDPDWFGGTEVIYKNTGERLAIIDTSGYVYLIDKRMSLRLKTPAQNEPMIFELLFENKVIAEIFIAVEIPAKLNLVTKDILTAGDTSFEKIKVPKYEKVGGVDKFIDVAQDDPYWAAVNDLKNKEIIGGYIENGQELFKPNQKISRAEFAKIILKMLCIFPADEAYRLPAVFKDIKQTSDWFYPFTKEGFLRKLIYGYGGERDLKTGLTPFKPNNNINLAEAVKIIIEALYIQGIIDFTRPEKIEGPWYSLYIAIAQDLKPYLKKPGEIKEAFVITREEALHPEKLLTRGEFAEIAYRVLRAYNCFEIDANNNGIPDYWELKHKITVLDDDPDKDGLKNIDEYKYNTDPLNPDTDGDGLKDGEEIHVYKTDPLDPDTDDDGLTDGEEILKYKTDPLDPDTDNGGVPDGIEVYRGTDPLNPLDDFGQKTNLPEGVYGILADCNSCPCPATIEYTANLMPGDIIYAVIINKNKTKVFSKSNEIIIAQ